MVNNCIFESWSNTFKARDNREIWEWAHDNITLPPVLVSSGKFDISSSPWFKEPFQSLKDSNIREINVCAPPRSGKSLISDLFTAYQLTNGSSILSILQTDELAKSHSELRLMPIVRNCTSLKDLISDDRSKTRNNEIILNNGLPLIVCGPAISNLQTRGFRTVILDECWIIAEKHPGRLTEAKSRLGEFKKQKTSKLLCISQGGMFHDDWHVQFNSGKVLRWNVTCLSCKKHFDPSWKTLQFDAGEEKRNIELAKKTKRIICPHCNYNHSNENECKLIWKETGKYISSDDSFNEKISYQWNSLIDTPWNDIIESWISARLAHDQGNSMPTIQFFQKYFAEFYNPNSEHESNISTIPRIELINDEENTGNKRWEKEDRIFMSIDFQTKNREFYYMIQAFSNDGESMIYDIDKVYSWETLREIQLKYNILDQQVCVDCGDNQTEVFSKCCEYGHMKNNNWWCWFALRGSGTNSFVHVMSDGNKIIKPYSRIEKADPTIGRHQNDPLRIKLMNKKTPLVTWGNLPIKDIASNRVKLMEQGKICYLASTVDDVKLSIHLHSEERRNENGKPIWKVRGKTPNHWWDCYSMNIVQALMGNMIRF